jgi:hypothetical protein
MSRSGSRRGVIMFEEAVEDNADAHDILTLMKSNHMPHIVKVKKNLLRFEPGSGVRLEYRRSFSLKGTNREGSSSSKSTVNLKNDIV